LGADKNYNTKGFVAEMRLIAVKPHVAQNAARPCVPPSMAATPATESRRCLAGSSRSLLHRSNSEAASFSSNCAAPAR
jgi:hypothetical protein